MAEIGDPTDFQSDQKHNNMTQRRRLLTAYQAFRHAGAKAFVVHRLFEDSEGEDESFGVLRENLDIKGGANGAYCRLAAPSRQRFSLLTRC